MPGGTLLRRLATFRRRSTAPERSADTSDSDLSIGVVALPVAVVAIARLLRPPAAVREFLLESRARRLIGVYGNNDGPALRARLPEVAYADLDGLRLAVIHETGPAQGRERRCAERFPDLDVLVFGHRHIPWDTTTDTGLRLLNPGSPTDRRRQPHCTYMTARVTDGRLEEVRLHRLPPRT